MSIESFETDPDTTEFTIKTVFAGRSSTNSMASSAATRPAA